MRRAALAIALNILAFATSADGQDAPPKPARLIYIRSSGADTCPDESYVHTVVAAHFGKRDPFAADAPRWITVTIDRTRDGFAALATLADSRGTNDLREKSARSCPEVLDRIALSIWDWLRYVPTGARDTAAKVPPNPAPQPPTTAPPPPPPPPHVRFLGELGPLVSFGVLPGSSAGFAGAVRARWPALSLGVEGSAQQLSSAPFTSLSLVYGSVVPCLHVDRFLGCALLSSGVLTTIGTATVASTHYYGAAGVRLGLEFAVSPRVAIVTTGDAVAPLSRDSETIGTVTLWTTPSMGLALGTRLVASF